LNKIKNRGEKNMKKMIALMIVGMFVLVGCGTVVMGEPDDPVGSNRAPGAPIIMEGQSRMEGKDYQCFFYAVDPDGDEVYYDLNWEKIDNKNVATCGPDDPVYPWLGPFNSGEEVNELRECCESGDYELTIRVKDEFGKTTVTVSYTKALQLPFARILARYPGFVYFLTKIFKF